MVAGRIGGSGKLWEQALSHMTGSTQAGYMSPALCNGQRLHLWSLPLMKFFTPVVSHPHLNEKTVQLESRESCKIIETI